MNTKTKTARKPLYVRVLHWGVALSFLMAFATSYKAFDFSTGMPIWVREMMFGIHRISGLLAAALLFIWFFARLKALTWTSWKTDGFRPLGVFHLSMGESDT